MKRVQLAESQWNLTPDTGPARQHSAVRNSTSKNALGKEETVCV